MRNLTYMPQLSNALKTLMCFIFFHCYLIFSSFAQSVTPPKSLKSKTIVFVTGAFVSNRCWEEWQRYFESQGFTTLAPAWPHKGGDLAALRNRHPDSAIASLTLTQVVDHYAEIIKKLPEKPILMGHSFGGLITQLLVQRGLAEAGIIYHSVGPKGVVFYPVVLPQIGYTSTWALYFEGQNLSHDLQAMAIYLHQWDGYG